MKKSTQQTYYDQHYSISDANTWQTWRPNPKFTDKKPLSEYSKNFFQEDAQEAILATLFSFAPFKQILDIGCSAGDFLIPLSRNSTHSYGVDIVDFSLAWQTLQKEYNIEFQQINLDYADLPFDDSSFNLVTMLMVLEHVFDVHHAIKEVARVLEPGGISVIQVPNIGCIKHRLDLLVGRLPCTSNIEKRDNFSEWDGQHLHYFTLATLSSLLNQYGLQVQTVKCSGKWARFRYLYPSLLGGDLIVYAKKPLL